jgi:predicted metalloprotease with PDZ domain
MSIPSNTVSIAKPRAVLALAAALFSMSLGLSLATPAAQPNGQIRVPAIDPEHRPYAGSVELTVDASDVAHRVVRVSELIHHPEVQQGELILAFPKWLPGTHAPEGPIERIAGLRFTVNGQAVIWQRDPLDVFMFHVKGVDPKSDVRIEFDYLSPTSGRVGPQEVSHDITLLEWNELLLYPLAVWVRDIPVSVKLKLPEHYEFGSALETLPAAAGNEWIAFAPTDVETLIDSPVYSGRYAKTIELNPYPMVDAVSRAKTRSPGQTKPTDNGPPVKLHIFADRASGLEIKDEAIKAHRELITQASRLYGAHHYKHYDFLLSISDQVQQNGLEHHQSSEDGAGLTYFTEWDKSIAGRDLLAHEYTHSWNGKFRRPADLFTPNYHVPMQDSLLWVYEGQTQYWGEVLTARSGLWSLKQATESLALTAAYYATQSGRQWRSVADTTNDEIMNPRRPIAWRDWQRFEDYYSEGRLIWLEADATIRELTHEKKSLDDFAKAFFGIEDGKVFSTTYEYADVVSTLNVVAPYDWDKFLKDRIYMVDPPAPLRGLEKAGYQLVYNDEPNDILSAEDHEGERVSYRYSLGLSVSEHGRIKEVRWNSLAFQMGLTEDMEIIAINGHTFSTEVLTELLKKSSQQAVDIELIVKIDDQVKVVKSSYQGGLRIPHLQRIKGTPDRLADMLKPKTAA